MNRLDFKKIMILVLVLIVAVLLSLYSLRLTTLHCRQLFENLFDWKSLGVIGWARFIIRSLNEFKYSLAIFIIAIMGFNLIANYRQGNLFQHIEVFQHIEGVDDFENMGDVANGNLNRNDRQNVHNSAVTKHVIESIKKLIDKEKINNIKTQSIDEVYHEIHFYLKESNANNKSLAIDVLEQMYNFNAFHSGSGYDEMEILRLVWQRINHPINQAHQNDLKVTLLQQLADCKPDGSVMCLTGRITRILQTLECVDAENLVDIKPLWAIKEKISDYCARYSKKLLEKAPNNYKEAYECLDRTSEQNLLVKQYNQCLIRNLNNKFKLMYIDTHIINQKQLDEMTKTYYETIETL